MAANDSAITFITDATSKVLNPEVDNNQNFELAFDYDHNPDFFFKKIGLFDINKVDSFQTQVSLILFTAPNIEDNESMSAELQEKLQLYRTLYKKGNVLRCSSLVHSYSGLSEYQIKGEKLIENAIKEEYNLPVAASTGAKEITFKFNEASNMPVFRTFETIYEYTKQVVRGTCNPSKHAMETGEIDYHFSVYIINMDVNGLKIQNTIKLANCYVKSVSHDVIQYSKEAPEQKQCDVTVLCQAVDYNKHSLIFDELNDLGIVPLSDYEYIHGDQEIRIGYDPNPELTAGEELAAKQALEKFNEQFTKKMWNQFAQEIGEIIDKKMAEEIEKKKNEQFITVPSTENDNMTQVPTLDPSLIFNPPPLQPVSPSEPPPIIIGE